MLSMLLNATSKAECQFAMYHLGLWDLLSPHMISQSCTGLNSKKKKKCLFCWAGVNIPWAHQSLLVVWAQSKMASAHTNQPPLPALLQWELGKPACPMWCSKRCHLPRVVGVNPTLNSPLFSEFVIPLGAVLEGGYLLSQHRKVKPGRDHPEFKAMARIDGKFKAGWLCNKKSRHAG